MAMSALQNLIFFTALISVTAGFDWYSLFRDKSFEALQCQHDHTYSQKFKKNGNTVLETRPFTFKLYCIGKTATVSYATHMLGTFGVDSCEPDYIMNHILVPKQGPELPSMTTLYFINDAKECHSIDYQFTNFEGDRETEDVTPAVPSEPKKCAAEIYKNSADLTALDHFTSCIKLNNQLSKNVHHALYGDTPWWPNTMRIIPGVRTSDDVHHRKLLSCSFNTQGYEFQLLCMKVYGDTWNPKTREYEDKYAAYIESNGLYRVDRMNVTSCWEDDIVSSIFPPRYQSKPTGTPSHVFRFSYYTGYCMERSYTCTYTKSNFCTAPTSFTKITCPGKSEADAWFHPNTGKVGLWENCQGPYSSKALGYSISVNPMGVKNSKK